VPGIQPNHLTQFVPSLPPLPFPSLPRIPHSSTPYPTKPHKSLHSNHKHKTNPQKPLSNMDQNPKSQISIHPIESHYSYPPKRKHITLQYISPTPHFPKLLSKKERVLLALAEILSIHYSHLLFYFIFLFLFFSFLEKHKSHSALSPT
jgi:hypothetical protein